MVLIPIIVGAAVGGSVGYAAAGTAGAALLGAGIGGCAGYFVGEVTGLNDTLEGIKVRNGIEKAVVSSGIDPKFVDRASNKLWANKKVTFDELRNEAIAMSKIPEQPRIQMTQDQLNQVAAILDRAEALQATQATQAAA